MAFMSCIASLMVRFYIINTNPCSDNCGYTINNIIFAGNDVINTISSPSTPHLQRKMLRTRRKCESVLRTRSAEKQREFESALHAAIDLVSKLFRI